MTRDEPHPTDSVDSSSSEPNVLERHVTPAQRRVVGHVLKAVGYLTTAMVLVGALATETVLLDTGSVGFLADSWQVIAVVALVVFVAMALIERTLEEDEETDNQPGT